MEHLTYCFDIYFTKKLALSLNILLQPCFSQMNISIAEVVIRMSSDIISPRYQVEGFYNLKREPLNLSLLLVT